MAHLQVAGLTVSNVTALAYPLERLRQRQKAGRPTVSSTPVACKTCSKASKLMHFPAVQFDILFAHTPVYPDEAPLIKLSK